ncbi:MAG TPA: hypothetical protein VM487_12935 [Phycisphaerae bacterium]|nr:hypothetical protein [Phycisphaerae bacterium]
MPELLIRVQNVSTAPCLFLLEGLERKGGTEPAEGIVELVTLANEWHRLIFVQSDAPIDPGQTLELKLQLDGEHDVAGLKWNVRPEVAGRWNLLALTWGGKSLLRAPGLV